MKEFIGICEHHAQFYCQDPEALLLDAINLQGRQRDEITLEWEALAKVLITASEVLKDNLYGPK